MKHAGPVHHDDDHHDGAHHNAPHQDAQATPPQPHDDDSADAGISTGAWIAIGGTLLAGAAAAIAVPLLRGRATPVASRRGKKATSRKKAQKARA